MTLKILVTGGDGYVGSSLAGYLKGKYEVIAVTRKDFDLSSSVETNNWFKDKFFDVVIHTAITGGSRIVPDKDDVLDMNLKMYYNLLEQSKHFNRFINLGSGAEKLKTDTLYGLSKHIIRTSLLKLPKFYNVRLYGLFDENELNSRFIKNCLVNYIRGREMVIHQNRYMDFFYMRDFYKVIDHYITERNVPKEYDCAYTTSNSLLYIANIINELGPHKVNINTILPELGSHYTADHPRTVIDLRFVGLHQGITEVYDRLCKK